MDDRQLEALASSLTELSEALAEVGDGQDIAQLCDLIRQPGWTTEPERELMTIMTKSLIGQVNNVIETKSAVVDLVLLDFAHKHPTPSPPPAPQPPPEPPPPGPDGPPGL